MIYHAILRPGYFPSQWKVAQVIMIPKPGKPPQEVYLHTNPIVSFQYLFGKLSLNRINAVINREQLIPEDQDFVYITEWLSKNID